MKAVLLSIGLLSFPVGAVVRQGELYELNQTPRVLLYKFKQESVKQGSKETITTVFSGTDGKVAVEEKVVKVGDQLQSYSIDQKQEGYLNLLSVQGNQANYTRTQVATKQVQTDQDSWGPNYVVPPTLPDFANRNWDAILAGTHVNFQLAIVEKQTTYSFEIYKDSESVVNGRSVITLKAGPTSFFVSLVLGPFTLVVDKASRTLLRIQGPALPKIAKGPNEMRDLEADTVYVEPKDRM